MQQGEGHDYFASRKMGRQLLESPYDTRWWETSKYFMWVRRFDPLPSDSRVLDLGCGLGQGAYFLAEGFGDVIGVDLSAFAINFAKQTYQRSNLRFLQADIFSFELEVPVDAIFCMDFIEHFESAEVRTLLARIYRFLKPDGRPYAHVPIAQSRAGAKKLKKYKHKNPHQSSVLDHTGDPTHKSTFNVPAFNLLLNESGFVISDEIRKIYCWRPVRWLYRGFLKLPWVSNSWRDQATYSYIVMARRALSPMLEPSLTISDGKGFER